MHTNCTQSTSRITSFRLCSNSPILGRAKKMPLEDQQVVSEACPGDDNAPLGLRFREHYIGRECGSTNGSLVLHDLAHELLEGPLLPEDLHRPLNGRVEPVWLVGSKNEPVSPTGDGFEVVHTATHLPRVVHERNAPIAERAAEIAGRGTVLPQHEKNVGSGEEKMRHGIAGRRVHAHLVRMPAPEIVKEVTPLRIRRAENDEPEIKR